jgi:hypothetical protein
VPTLRKKIPQKKAIKNRLPSDLYEYFLKGNPNNDLDMSLDTFLFVYPANEEEEEKLISTWDHHREAILKNWIKEHPGTRPFMWWELEAPEEPRKRLGGKGITPWDAGKAVNPVYYKGAPDTERMWQHKWLLDTDDPPMFESEAAYLKRLCLLTKEEMTGLDFKPESIYKILRKE